MKINIKYFFNAFFSILIILTACNQDNIKIVTFQIKKEENNYVSLKINPKNIKFVFLKPEKIRGSFTEIAIMDSLLICGNLRSNKLLNIYSLNNGKLKQELIDRGESQKEGLSASNIFGQNNLLWIYDITLSNVFKMEFKSGEVDSNFIKKMNLSKDLKNIYSPVFINNNLILATTYSMDNFRYLYASSQNIIKKVGQLPEVENSQFLSDILKTKFPNKAYIFKANVVKSPTENKIAVFYNKADRIEFYSNDKLLKIIQSQDGFSPIMQVTKVEEGGFYVEECDKTIYAHLSTSYTEKYIYSLYSGNNETTSNKILVFDWEGHFIKELSLDRKVSKIFVDGKRNFLYCYEIQGNGIYSVNLNF